MMLLIIDIIQQGKFNMAALTYLIIGSAIIIGLFTLLTSLFGPISGTIVGLSLIFKVVIIITIRIILWKKE
jgi:uncharacterized membrane protein